MNAAAILVVDDEPQIRRVMRTTLSSHGYVIREATTGEEAVEAVRKERPDLILLDVNMPGIGGIAAAREIREMSFGRRDFVPPRPAWPGARLQIAEKT